MIIPGIAGRIEADNASLPKAQIEDLSAVTTDTTRCTRFASAGVAGVVVDGDVVVDGGVCCVAAGHIDWLRPDLADLQMKRNRAQALLQAYRQQGRGLLDLIGGRFAILVWDSHRRLGIVAGDRFGQMPVYWSTSTDGTLVFGQTAGIVAGQLPAAPALAEQGLFNYLYFHMVPAPGTIYRGINKLLAAHACLVDGAAVSTERYWMPAFREASDASMSDATEEMMGLLSSSVARLAVGADTGAFLSGGLDSSTVAGLLARHRPHPKTYSIGFDADGYDEIAFARLASERFATDFRSYYVTPEDVLDALPRIAAAYDEPFGNSSALPAYFCARIAVEDGRERLLAGDGGDELFAGNERYAKQRVFEHYQQIPGLLRRLLVEPMVQRWLPEGARLVSKARSYIEQAQTPLPDRLHSYNFVNRLGAQSILSGDLLAAVDTAEPQRLSRELYHAASGATDLNRMLMLDWHHTLADNDLRKVNRMCQLAGIDVEYPMLDDHVVAFSTRVSSPRKMQGGKLRGFYKQAVKGFLPDRIINKSKHGFGLPFGVWMAEHPGLQALAQDNLARIRQRDFIRPEFIDELIRLHKEHHAGYYGEMIWILIMLELWLDNRTVAG